MTPPSLGVRTELVEGPDGPLEVIVHGHDPTIMLLPSAGRGAEDFDDLDDDRHLAAVRQAFFAPGNDPSVWADGRHPVVAWVQGLAQDSPPVEEWWTAGAAPVLVLQPEHDVIAVAANAADLAAQLGERATVETLAGAGHALLPERPDAVADAVLRWLRRPPR